MTHARSSLQGSKFKNMMILQIPIRKRDKTYEKKEEVNGNYLSITLKRSDQEEHTCDGRYNYERRPELKIHKRYDAPNEHVPHAYLSGQCREQVQKV